MCNINSGSTTKILKQKVIGNKPKKKKWSNKKYLIQKKSKKERKRKKEQMRQREKQVSR